MTCLHCSFQASSLLVFWEPRCLPTMAWLAQLPGFLAWRRLHPLFLRGEWQGWLAQSIPPVSPQEGLRREKSV